jgi:hypothetical protein
VQEQKIWEKFWNCVLETNSRLLSRSLFVVFYWDFLFKRRSSSGSITCPRKFTYIHIRNFWNLMHKSVKKRNTNLSYLHRGGFIARKSLLLVLREDITHVRCSFLRIPSVKFLTDIPTTVAVFTVHLKTKRILLW